MSLEAPCNIISLPLFFSLWFSGSLTSTKQRSRPGDRAADPKAKGWRGGFFETEEGKEKEKEKFFLLLFSLVDRAARFKSLSGAGRRNIRDEMGAQNSTFLLSFLSLSHSLSLSLSLPFSHVFAHSFSTIAGKAIKANKSRSKREIRHTSSWGET